MTTIRGATTLTLGAGTDANITGANANITATTNANITASGLINISGGFVYSVQNISGPGAINLTDEAPEVNGDIYGWEPFDFTLYDTRGRTVYLSYQQSL